MNNALSDNSLNLENQDLEIQRLTIDLENQLHTATLETKKIEEKESLIILASGLVSGIVTPVMCIFSQPMFEAGIELINKNTKVTIEKNNMSNASLIFGGFWLGVYVGIKVSSKLYYNALDKEQNISSKLHQLRSTRNVIRQSP